MEILTTDIPDVLLLEIPRFGDDRGFFSETFRSSWLEGLHFVQDNHSLSVDVGTVRGLHFQSPPFAQDKLVRVSRGAVLDVAVDIRRGSPTYGQHVAVELSADNWRQLLVPKGFAHGFCTLEPDTDVLYKVTDFYSLEHDLGLLWNDPALGIDWPVTAETAVLSDKDRSQPELTDLPAYFTLEA